MKKSILLGGLFLAFSATAFGQNGNGYWKKLQKTHPETTLEKLEQSAAPAVSQAPMEEPVLPACRLSLVYEGKTRNITMECLNLMKQKGMKASSIRQYRKELLFTSAEKEVWLPVKSTLVGQLEIEVREDEPVLLYATVLQEAALQEKPVTLLVQDFQVK